jgi:hypothetical protein
MHLFHRYCRNATNLKLAKSLIYLLALKNNRQQTNVSLPLLKVCKKCAQKDICSQIFVY